MTFPCLMASETLQPTTAPNHQAIHDLLRTEAVQAL